MYVFDQVLVGNDSCGDPHVGTIILGYLPNVFIDLFEGNVFCAQNNQLLFQ